MADALGSSNAGFKMASEHDRMIELKWTGFLAESAAVLGISNFNDS